MSEKPQEPIFASGDVLGVLTRELQVRIINCSYSGCLVETDARVEVGTVGSLRLVFDGNELSDDVQVVRCQPIQGAGSVYQVGAQFLLTGPPGDRSLRRAVTQKLAVGN